MLNRLLLSLAVASTSAVAEVPPFQPILPNTVADPSVINDRFDSLRQGVNGSQRVWYLKANNQPIAYALFLDDAMFLTFEGY